MKQSLFHTSAATVAQCATMVATAVPMMVALPHIAQAQTFPIKPMRIIVPVAPGGNLDIVARALAAPMTETFGQQVIV